MKTLLITIGILLLTGNLYGQDYYMYVDGKRRYYKVSPNKMLVQYFDGIIDSAKISNSFQKMSVKTRKTKAYMNEFMLVETEGAPKEQVVNLAAKWNDLEKDAYISPILTGEDGTEFSFVPNQILVRIKETKDYSVLLQKLQSYHVKTIELCDYNPKTYLITLSNVKQKSSMQMAGELYESGLFDNVEPHVFHFIKRLTNDTHYQQQWALHNNTAGIKAEQAWMITTGSPNVRVAILDTGVDLDHPDLAGNLLEGFNASTGALNGGVELEEKKYEHGTACAGIVAAKANNNKGTAGVAYNCKILPIYDGGGVVTAKIVAAINWARENGADVISISNGYTETTELSNAIHTAATVGRNNLGCVIVAGSGNDDISTVIYPANHPDVISVGAINQNGNRADDSFGNIKLWGSNYGDNLDVVAPGVGIYTPGMQKIPANYNTVDNGTDGIYFSGFYGTSAACPHVSGVAALILSVRSDLRQEQVRRVIESTCTKLPAYGFSNKPNRLNGTWNNEVGYGLVNAYAAILSAIQPTYFTVEKTAQMSPYANSQNIVRVENCTNCPPNGLYFEFHVKTKDPNNYYGWSYVGAASQPNMNVSLLLSANEPYDNYLRRDNNLEVRCRPVAFGRYGGYETTFLVPCPNCRFAYSVYDSINGPFRSIIFPNPVSNILNVKIDQEAYLQAEANTPTVTDGKRLSTKPEDFDIRLYDGQGNLLRQRKIKAAGKVEFSVANLPNGIYYLHIYDGVNDKPEMRQIVVEH